MAGQDPDGSEFLLSNLDGQPATYQRYAAAYYERDVDVRSIEHVYAHRPLTESIVASLNRELTLGDLATEMAEIGYPSGP